MINPYGYFYDAQWKRFQMQIVRAFSGFQYQVTTKGVQSLQLVPCLPASRNRQVAAIRRSMSENVLMSVPMISVDITGVALDKERLMDTGFIDVVTATERAKDQQGNYTSGRGNSITVERLMPRPLTLTFQIDIWTSNMDQKHQLLEQILTVISPTFDIQNSDSALDWSALAMAHLEEITFSSLNFPIADNEIDVATLTLSLPMWLSPPARVSRQSIIEQINTNIDQGVTTPYGLDYGDTIETVMTTPGDYFIQVDAGTVILLNNAGEDTVDGSVIPWSQLFQDYHITLQPNITQLYLHSEDGTPDIVGTIQPTSQSNIMSIHIDPTTLPVNTLPTILAVIDPHRSTPGDGTLAPSADGQRYLITADLSPSQMWGNITAQNGSILQRTNGSWVVIFNPAMAESSPQYVLNQTTGKQYKWTNVDGWRSALMGIYSSGYFSICNPID